MRPADDTNAINVVVVVVVVDLEALFPANSFAVSGASANSGHR